MGPRRNPWTPFVLACASTQSRLRVGRPAIWLWRVTRPLGSRTVGAADDVGREESRPVEVYVVATSHP